MKRINYLLVGFAMASMGAEQTCGTTQILRDPGFDLWCGDHLCAWKVERGDATRVATWNEADPGVQLVGNDAAIEQLSPVDNLGFGPTCIEFKMIANVDLDARVSLNVDVDGDGTLETVEQIPTAAWQPLRFLILVEPPFAGIRFELAKQGTGTAILADIEANTVTDCGIAPVSAQPFPLGSPCVEGTDCASGICAMGTLDVPFAFGQAMVCQGCDATSCTGTDVCGASEPVGPVRAVPDICVAPASKPLGDICELDQECETGLCVGHACSTCSAGTDCAAGDGCGPGWAQVPQPPFVCAPGAGKRTTGQPCATDDDCASSSCSGTPAGRCADGRPCGNDIDCPFIDDSASANSKINGSCTVVGVDGGTCT